MKDICGTHARYTLFNECDKTTKRQNDKKGFEDAHEKMSEQARKRQNICIYILYYIYIIIYI